MFIEEKIILLSFLVAYGFFFTILFLAATKNERKVSKDRKTVIHGATNYARFQAALVTSSQVIRRGSLLKRVNQYYPHGRG